MIYTDTSICNMALSHVGGGVISSLSEKSTQAQKCNVWYDHCRKMALASFDWGFARKRLTLATHSDEPPSDTYLYRYQFPADCLRARHIQNPYGSKANPIPYKIEIGTTNQERSILTDLNEAVLVYTMDLDQPERFSEAFADALSHFIAAYLAPPITGRHKSIKETEFQIARSSFLSAMAHEANEEMEDAPRDADWIRGRDTVALEIETPVLRDS